MDQLLKIFLFAASVFGSFSKNIYKQTGQFKPENLPIQFDEYYGLDPDIYPRELIQKMVDALTPEELEALKIDNNIIGDRDGDTSTDNCDSYSYTYVTHILPAADEYKTLYNIAHLEDDVKEFTFQVCNKTTLTCSGNVPIYSGSKGCCFNGEERRLMHVYSTPVNEYDTKADKKYYLNKKAEIIIKMMLIPTNCKCENVYKLMDDDMTCSQFDQKQILL